MAFLDEIGLQHFWTHILSKINDNKYSYLQFKHMESELPNIEDWNDITYGDGTFVVIAKDSNVAAYSQDGAIWITTTMPSVSSWCKVAYGNGKFVALSEDGKMAYSLDGITWVANDNYGVGMIAFTDITFGEGMFVATGTFHTNDGQYNIIYSSDGLEWHVMQTPIAFEANFKAVTYANGKFVAVPNNSQIGAYSEDGINWTSMSMPGAATYTCITYGNGKYVTLVDNNKAYAYSTDGITWSVAELFYDAPYSDITFGNGVFVTLARNNNCCGCSSDGINWTTPKLVSSDDANRNWSSIIFANNRFVAIANGDMVIANSTNGTDWKTEFCEFMQNDEIVTEYIKDALGI